MEIKRKVDELIVRGNATQFSDSAYREGLGYWIWQGVFGTPWLLAKIGQLAVTYMNIGRGQAKKDSEVHVSAPVLAVLSSEINNRFWCRENEDFVYALERWKGKYSDGGMSSLSRKLLRYGPG